MAKDPQETKAEQRVTKAALQETNKKVALQEAKAALQKAKEEQTETETKTEREVANLKAMRTTQGAHEGSSSLVGSDRIVSGSFDKTIKVWRLADGNCEKTLEGHRRTSPVWQSCPGGQPIVSGSHDSVLKIWRLVDGSCESREDPPRTWVWCLLCGGAARGGADRLWLP